MFFYFFLCHFFNSLHFLDIWAFVNHLNDLETVNGNDLETVDGNDLETVDGNDMERVNMDKYHKFHSDMETMWKW